MFLYQLKEPDRTAVMKAFREAELPGVSPSVTVGDSKVDQIVIIYSPETDNFWIQTLEQCRNGNYQDSELIHHIGSFWDTVRRTYLAPGKSLIVKKTGARAYVYNLDRFFEKHKYTAAEKILWDSEELDHLLMKYDRDIVRVSFAVQYLCYPQIEKLYKAGFDHIIHNFVLRDLYTAEETTRFEECFADENKINTITSLTKGQWSEMIRYRLTLDEWIWLKRMLNTYKISDSSLPVFIRMTIRGGSGFMKDFASVCRISEDGSPVYEADQLVSDLARDHGNTGLEPHQACRYLCDYIRMCRRNRIVPAYRSTNLREEHDTLVIMENEKKHRRNDEKTQEIYDERFNELSCYLYEDEELAVILPHKYSDLIYEGRHNHNCVGSIYVSRYEKGQSNIFFIREKSKIEESYITVELNRACDSTVQAFYSHNRRITKKRDLKFIDRWLEHNRRFNVTAA